MEKKKLELAAVGVLLMVFGLSFILNLQKTMQKMQAVKMPTEPASAETKASSPLFSTIKTTVKRDTSSRGWGRDPFVLEESSNGDLSSISNLRLMGITSFGGKPQKAIINNLIVSVGSTVGKFRVLDISNDSVLVSDGKETYSLRIVR